MRHASHDHAPCQSRILAVALTLMALSTDLAAQALVSFGYSRQHVNAGTRSESLGGFAGELDIRLARPIGLLLGYESVGHGFTGGRDPFQLGVFKTGVLLRPGTGRYGSFDIGVGLGLASLDVDREEDGGGTMLFLEPRFCLYPAAVAGACVGGVVHSMAGIGSNIDASSWGLTLSLVVRPPGW